MKRIASWILGTVSVLVLLFGYHTSTSGTLATGTSIHSGSFTSSAGSTGTTAPSTTPKGTSSPRTKAGKTKTSGPVQRKVTGSIVNTEYGPVQVGLTISGRKIVKASVLQYPNGNDTDTQINDQALPILTHETINAQSAKIDMVSGATYTSNGYIHSLQSALDQAQL